MRKIIIFFLATITVFCSCHSVVQNDKRKVVVNEFIAAVNAFDTSQLYLLVDTSEYFSVQDKAHLLYQMELLKGKFLKCGSIIADSTVKVSKRDIPFTDYIYSFCSNIKGEEFQIIFTFPDFDNKNRINYIEIINYHQTTVPATTPSNQRSN